MAPLNHTLPVATFRAFVQLSSVQQVITSRTYLKTLSAAGTDTDSLLQGFELLYMEELSREAPYWRRALDTLAFRVLPAAWFYALKGHKVAAGQPAAILLNHSDTSNPLTVLLSHRNIMVNCKQISDVLNTRTDDVILSCIPGYHPMALTLTTLMPLVEGIPMACHADPTDALGIAKTVARCNATVLPSSPDTLGNYARNNQIHPLMLESLRLVVCGGERLPNKVRREFELKFGKNIYEGYGAAETTTVATVNIPDAMDSTDWKVQQGNIPGSMGMPVPGTGLKIVNEFSGEELPLGQEGLLLVCGGQVMPGYLGAPEQTATAIFEIDGQHWFRTGKKARLTEEGFLVLHG